MFTDYVFLMFGILVWIEFLVGIRYCVVKNHSYLATFLRHPFGIPMPSMTHGIVVRALLIATGTIGIVKFLI